MAIVGQLLVNLRANTASYARDLKKANRISFSNAKEIKRSLSIIGKAAAVMGIAVAAGFAILIKKSIDAADNLLKLSRSTGIAIESLSALGYAAEQSGLEQAQFAQRMTNLNRRAKEAARGVKTYQLAFDTLGIAVVDAQGNLRSTEDLLFDVADAFSKMEDGSMKAALATDIFSNQGVEMITFLNEGRAGLEKLSEEAKRAGQVISLDTALAAERFNDNLSRLSASGRGMANVLMAELIPMLDHFSGKMSVDVENSPFGKGMKFLGESARRMAGSMILAVGAGEQLGLYWKQNWAAAINAARGDWEGFKASYDLGLFDMRRTGDEVMDDILKMWVRYQDLRNEPLKLPPPADPGAADGVKKLTAQQKLAIEMTNAWNDQLREWRDVLILADREMQQAEKDTLAFAAAQAEAGLAIKEGVGSDMLRRKLKEYRDGLAAIKEKTDEVKRASDDMSHVIGQAFEDAILSGEGLRGIMQGLLEDIGRILLRMAVTKPMENFFGSLFAGLSGGGGLLGGLFGGGRQHGGPVEPGKAYIVGEGGTPEIFMPDARGKVIPMKQRLAGQTIIYQIDARGAEGATEAKIRRALIATHESAVKQSQRRFADNARRSA